MRPWWARAKRKRRAGDVTRKGISCSRCAHADKRLCEFSNLKIPIAGWLAGRRTGRRSAAAQHHFSSERSQSSSLSHLRGAEILMAKVRSNKHLFSLSLACSSRAGLPRAQNIDACLQESSSDGRMQSMVHAHTKHHHSCAFLKARHVSDARHASCTHPKRVFVPERGAFQTSLFQAGYIKKTALWKLFT